MNCHLKAKGLGQGFLHVFLGKIDKYLCSVSVIIYSFQSSCLVEAFGPFKKD